MINFYGGQKGENYVISKVFSNRAALIDDLKLEENSEVGLYEIIMISYGEYSSDIDSDYYNNLKADNKHLELAEGENLLDKDNLNNFNSALFQKVPNGNWQKTDVFIEENVQFDENGDLKNPNDIIQIGLYKYQFLTSSMGATPRLQLFTGEAKEAWEEPEVIEREDFSVAIPKFDLLMPKAPTIIGSNGNSTNSDIGILINPEAKDKSNTSINPYQVVSFTTKPNGEDKLINKSGIDSNGNYGTWVEYTTQASVNFGVNYNSVNLPEEVVEIGNIRGPEGPPGRIPQIINGNWYNWQVENGELILNDSGISASFRIVKVIETTGEYIDDVITNVKDYITTQFITSEEVTEAFQYNNDVVIGQITWPGSSELESDDEHYTIACFKLSNGSIGWSYFAATGSNFLIQQGINDNSIEQYNTNSSNQSKAGTKGYYYHVIDKKNKLIFLSKQQNIYPQIITGTSEEASINTYMDTKNWNEKEITWEVNGAGLSLVNDEKYDYLSNGNSMTFISATYNVIKYAGELGFNDLIQGEDKIDDYSIYKVDEPQNGYNLIRQGSIAFGDRTQSNGLYSLAEGRQTEARGNYGHAEGRQTIANYASHSEGYGSKAYGQVSHAEGQGTEARASFSHTEGDHTIAGSTTQHVQGRCNIIDAENKYAHIVGNGSSPTNRRNIHTVDWDGNSWFQGSVISRTYSIILSVNGWQQSQDKDGVDKYTQQIILNDFNSHGEDWSVIINPAYTNNMTKLELQNYQREYNRLSSGYILTETAQNKDEMINFTVFDRHPQEDLTIIIKVV